MADNNNGSSEWGMNPRRTRAGIKPINEDNNFGRNWWARRWISAMEALVSGPRLARGQFYALQGQVVSVEENKEGILAQVQGSRPRPYRVSIRLTPLTQRQWNKVLDILSDQAIFAAQLLSGEMPQNIEEAFTTAGVSLFPQSNHDMMTDCTCPDKANPCKHVAATHYILGERFNEDPFLLFRMRGRTQEQILTALRQRRSGGGQLAKSEPRRSQQLGLSEDVPRLEESLDTYWQSGRDLHQFSIQVKAPDIRQPLLKRLGEPEFVRDLTLQSQLEEVYEAVSQFAILLAYSDVSAPSMEEDHE